MGLLLRSFFPVLRQNFLRRRLLILFGCSLAVGALLSFVLSYILPSPARASTIVASFGINLLGLSVILALLPEHLQSGGSWACFCAWMNASIVAGFGFVGLAIANASNIFGAPAASNFGPTFLKLWILFAAQAAMVTATHALISSLFYPAKRFSKVVTLLGLGCIVTALFWTKIPIQLAPRQRGSTWANAVMKLSPVLNVASAWYYSPERLDLIHGPLTYGVWIGDFGSYSIAYPRILPSFDAEDNETWSLGIVGAMLLWGLPIIVLCDIFSATVKTRGLQNCKLGGGRPARLPGLGGRDAHPPILF